MSEPTVHLVDDDPSVRTAFGWLFESVGLPVRSYPDGEAFLAAFDPAMRGCVVVDGHMPGLGGIGLLQALRRRGNRMPVLYLSGCHDADSTAAARAAGVAAICTKPIAGAALLDQVRALLDT
ncbi:response regulator [Nitrogeniibacter mangrovi]|uniref:Response regulator n=1 Tax=Nitrogeniibacter mangrovi TaxID=2016596 RepID=A0A6C1AZL8_9RHOO|nr:response regulator [Nitrogeniibacter mangrovi]QID16811.1 response regulator [Nitrogeniibacter mangrovi]